MSRRPAKSAVPAISAIVVCKDRLSHLRETLPRLMALPFAEVVVVDYDCPDHAGDWVAANFPSVKVVRIADRPIFKLAAGRNAGAAAATSPWLFFMDVDVKLAPDFLDHTAPLLRPGIFSVADPCPPELWGTMFVRREDYDAVEGYDEAFEGWGVEDHDMIDRLEVLGRKLAPFDGLLAECILHSDDLRTRHHELRDRDANGAINEFYRDVKRDLTRQGVVFDAPGRARLYAQLRASFPLGPASQTFNLTVTRRSAYGRTWTTTLTYVVNPPQGSPQAPNAVASAAKSETE